MEETTVIFRAADGATREARGEVVRYGSGARWFRAAAFVVGGLVGAAALIIVPVAHLCTTPGLPILGVFLGVMAYRTRAKVHDVKGPCPACGDPIELAGGRITVEPFKSRAECPRCHQPLELILPNDEA